MTIADSGHTQEHEDDGFRGTAQHLHCILDSCMGFVRNVGLHIILHCNTTKCNAAKAHQVFNQETIFNC
jgi:hypothetical protein